MAHSIDKATFEALEKGWITTAGVLVPGPWFPEVVRWARNHPNVDLGIRLDVNSDWSSYRWRPVFGVGKNSGLTDLGGYLSRSQLYVAHHASAEEVENEERAQIELGRTAGLPITHLDNHMRALLITPRMFQTYWKMGRAYSLPIVLSKEFLRMHGSPTSTPGSYQIGEVDMNIMDVPIDRELEIMPGFAQKDWLTAYEKTLESLPTGVYLLSVHLGFNDEELQAMTWDHPNWGAQWRQNDYDVISSPAFQKFLKEQGFVLTNWKNLSKTLAQH